MPPKKTNSSSFLASKGPVFLRVNHPKKNHHTILAFYHSSSDVMRDIFHAKKMFAETMPAIHIPICSFIDNCLKDVQMSCCTGVL
jgi:hypothetical protein